MSGYSRSSRTRASIAWRCSFGSEASASHASPCPELSRAIVSAVWSSRTSTGAESRPGGRLDPPAAIALGEHVARDPEQPLVGATAGRIERGDRLKRPSKRLGRQVTREVAPAGGVHEEPKHRTLEMPVKRGELLPARSRPNQQLALVVGHTRSISARAPCCDTAIG